MKDQNYWDLINEACLWVGEPYFKNNEDKANYLVNNLSKLSKEELIGFERFVVSKVVEADHYNVLALLEIMEGSGSDDSYLYFRYQLVMQGQKVFEDAISSTESLVTILDRHFEYADGECFMYMADKAYTNKFGEPEDCYELPNAHTEDIGGYTKGEAWKMEDLPILFPNLCRKFNYTI
ncbi:DUF4240 domain-containing protein [Cytophagaceae bacterium YF14B1]|uniref:DUF4240 domain-containing protein n=1 Tax=Xanthocytophaga flava TaxID=3048013 RepID=A0AAE3U534_9BACT|nr:DUF4240 domain-containing protein [Xanthocytophaga flavus]MDJ1480344.1 DUF4240 domain-containing protein [Xanthocytophaga flavus]